jgi:TolB-like protein/Flp pilus assembly protein TadD
MPAVSGKELIMAVVGAVADGRPVDWTLAESTPLSAAERSLLDELKVLEDLHRLHRSGTLGSSPAAAKQRDADTVHLDESPKAGGPDNGDTNVVTTSTATMPIPRTWGHLEIRSMLGVGGFGVGYQAWDPQLASEVALKVLTSETAEAGATVIQEARLLARVRHPNVVSIFGADRSAGQVGLWMELVRGRTLKQLVKQQGVFGAREAALVGLDLTRALAAVHRAGLVHRDVKPHNVMRDDSGRIVLMDFGAGIELNEPSHASQRKYVGTPLYMAPELFGRHQPSTQTDLYSLGVLLYHLVTGGYPIEGPSVDAVELQHVRGQRRRLRDARPDLPTEFVRIVEQAIDPDPHRRYESAGAMEADLARFVVQDNRAASPNVAEAPVGTAPPKRGLWNRSTVAAAAVLVLVTAGVSTMTFRLWRRAAVSPASSLRSLAVLPLRNVSGDPEQDYFVDGMSELLTADLSGVSALRVSADSATARYRGTKKSAAEIGRELHVDAIVEGSVARSGDRVRVTLQVIHAGTNLSVWGASFEREAADAFRLQADITRTLVSELRAALTAGERKRLEQTYAALPEAQELYLRARYDLHTYDRARMREARTLLERAVAIDPNYALAWASLARCYTLLQAWGELSPAESRRLGVAAARTALERDPAMFEAHSTLAEALFKFDWNWTEADAHYRQALDANPSFSTGRWQYARFLSATGRVDEAVVQARRAEETDPLSTDVKSTVAMMLVYQRQYAQAEAKANEASALEPSQQGPHMIRGRALASLERYDESIRELQEAVRLSTGSPGALAELGRVYAVAGHRQEAEQILEQLSRPPTSAGGFVNEQDAAYVQLGLGRYDEALAGFARAVDQKSERILWLRVDPRLDPLRNDARFQRLLQRIGGP